MRTRVVGLAACTVADPGDSRVSKPALVFLCQRLPFPPIKGERITSFNLLRHLTRNYRVFVGTFIDDPADRVEVDKLRALVAGLHVDEIAKPWAYAGALPRWLLGEPISFALFRSRRLDRWLDEVEARHRPVAIVTHSSNISAYAVDKFARRDGAQPRRVLHFADVDSEKFVAYAERGRGLRRWIFASEARRVRREERRLTAKADAVAFVSDEEADLFRSVLEEHRDRVVTLPNGVDTETFDPGLRWEPPFQGQGAAFAFTGAMDYPPNVDAVTWFSSEVFPAIRQALPGAQFLIVGSKPAATVQRLGGQPGVLVTGRVASVAAYLAHAQVAVAPLRIARGIQNKVLEAMAMAMPIVVSSGALTGIRARSGEHLVCADTPAEWIDACVRLVRDREEARRLGQSARKLVLDEYTWEAQFTLLDRLLR
jgi:sugar transferase (PEP-CTERM/EpsH1 system associated)